MHSVTSNLIATGVTLGFFHVLTGPDHLSALATLSANVDRRWTAFCLGIRWGIGHSTGLLLVGLILLLISTGSDSDDENFKVPDRVSNFFETLVGAFMIILGSYGLRRAWENKPQTLKCCIPANNNDLEDFIQEPEDSQSQSSKSRISSYHHPHFVHELSLNPNDDADDDAENKNAFQKCMHCFVSRIPPRTMAVVAGVIHGLAGPGGVLGVIPAVQMHDGKLAAIYLGFFCISSMLTMGLFATIYGTCSSAIAKRGTTDRAFYIEFVSACLSILVGIVWLTLSYVGKLDDIFP